MLEKAYIVIFFAVMVAQFFKPALAIVAIILIFSLKTYLLFPFHTDYHLSLVLGGAFFLAVAVRGFRTTNKEAISLVLYFIALCIISTVLNGNFRMEIFFNFLFELFKTLFLIMLILSVKLKKNDLILVLLAVFAGGLANGGYALIQQMESGGVRGFRSVGFADQPNAAALYMYMSIPLAYFFYTHAKNKIVQIFFIASMFVLGVGVITTGSRAGIVVTIVLCGVLFVKNIKKPITVVMIAAFALFAAGLVAERFAERKVIVHRFSGSKMDSSVKLRADLARHAIVLWFCNPVFGVGPGNFPKARAEKYNLQGFIAGAATHSTHLQVLSETGTLGMLIFIAFFLKGFKALKRTAEQGDAFFKELAENTKVFLVTLCFGSLYGCNLATEIYWLWLIVPFLVSSACLTEKEENTLSQPVLA